MNAFDRLDPLRTLVVSLASVGFPISRIAECLNLPEQSLRQYFPYELDFARTQTEVQARAVLTHMVKSGRYPAVTQSLLKPPPLPPAEFNPNCSPRGPILRPLDTTKPLDIIFYRNDGEPNAED